MESKTKEDGGIYDKGLQNYTTAVAVMALKEANKDGKYDAAIKKAAEYIKHIQHVEDGINQGGFSYDGKEHHRHVELRVFRRSPHRRRTR